MFSPLLWSAFYGTCGIFGLGLSLVYIFQERLIYVPHAPGMMQEYEYSPNQAHLNFKDLWLETTDKKKLHGWLMWHHAIQLEQLRTHPVILFFQANAGNISHRIPFFAAMIQALDCAVVAISYRGYGPSQGSPTEAGLKLDADTALEFCYQYKHFDRSKIFVFGRSLGGAVALAVTAENQHKIAGLILENTFTSITDMAGVLFPLLRPIVQIKTAMRFLVRNKWQNNETIQKVTDKPILFLSSGKDEMVPPKQMKELHSLCCSSSVTFREFPDAMHMDAFDTSPVSYWTAIKDFILSATSKTKKS